VNTIWKVFAAPASNDHWYYILSGKQLSGNQKAPIKTAFAFVNLANLAAYRGLAPVDSSFCFASFC
jgi:hypothetical protein